MKTAYLSIPCLATCLGISLLSMTTLSSCSKESSSSATVAASKFPTEKESLTDYRLDMDIAVLDNSDAPHQLKQNPDSITFLTPNNAELSFEGTLYPVTYRGPCKISPSRKLVSKMSETARLLPHFGENLQLFGLT